MVCLRICYLQGSGDQGWTVGRSWGGGRHAGHLGRMPFPPSTPWWMHWPFASAWLSATGLRPMWDCHRSRCFLRPMPNNVMPWKQISDEISWICELQQIICIYLWSCQKFSWQPSNKMRCGALRCNILLCQGGGHEPAVEDVLGKVLILYWSVACPEQSMKGQKENVIKVQSVLRETTSRNLIPWIKHTSTIYV